MKLDGKAKKYTRRSFDLRVLFLVLFYDTTKRVVSEGESRAAIIADRYALRIVKSYGVVVDLYVLLRYGDACICIAGVVRNSECCVLDGLGGRVVSSDKLVIVDLNVFNVREHHDILFTNDVYLVVSEYNVLNRGYYVVNAKSDSVSGYVANGLAVSFDHVVLNGDTVKRAVKECKDLVVRALLNVVVTNYKSGRYVGEVRGVAPEPKSAGVRVGEGEVHDPVVFKEGVYTGS